jgi:ATP synthase protein I
MFLTGAGLAPMVRALSGRLSIDRASRGAMSEHAPEPDDLRVLGERIDALRRQEFPEPKAKAPSSGEVAIRFATELLAAVIVGAAIGFGLDKLFGTRWPFLTVVGFLLGAGAGIRNVIAASKEIARRTAAAAEAKDEEQ